MRALVCGGRNYRNKYRIKEALSSFEGLNGEKIGVLIHGGASGADSLAGNWALNAGIRVEVYPAEWNRLGRAAGHIRNAKMLKDGKPDVVIAFPGGRGTANMMHQAVLAKVRVVRIKD